eukprot:tig00021127_g18853.t1
MKMPASDRGFEAQRFRLSAASAETCARPCSPIAMDPDAPQRDGFFICTCTRDSVCVPCKERVCKLHGRDLDLSKPGAFPQHFKLIKENQRTLRQSLGRKHALSAAHAIRLAYIHYMLSKAIKDTKKAFAALNVAVRLYEPTLALYAEDARLRAATEPGALADHAEILGGIYSKIDDLAAAKRVLLWALSFRQESQGPLHEDTTATEYMLGYAESEVEGAEPYFRAAFAHEQEAGHEAAIARRCCRLPVAATFLVIAERHADGGRSEHALGLMQMALAIAERVCPACLERGFLEQTAMGFARLWEDLGDFVAAQTVIRRLVEATEQRLGPAHRRVGSALIHLARFFLNVCKLPDLVEPYARRAWKILEATEGPTSPGIGDELFLLWTHYERAPHFDPYRTFRRIVYEWARENKRPPSCMTPETMERIVRDQESPVQVYCEYIGPNRDLADKLEQRRREREERRRAEEERERARREAERAERAARDAADREAAQRHVEGARWAPARKLLDALLKVRPPAAAPAASKGSQRSPDDFEACLLRIQCMAGAGQLEAAGREAEKAERELAGSGAGADALRRIQEQRHRIAAEMQQREEAKRMEEEEARRRAEEQRRERERQAEQRLREEQERQQQERQEEARRAAEAAAAALELLRLEEEARAWEERRREEDERQAAEAERRREQERRRRAEATREQQRREEQARQAAEAPQTARTGAAACRFFAAGFCRDGARCRFQHGAAAPAAAPAEAAFFSSSRSWGPAQAAPCRFFARGACRDGARCRYRHYAGPAGPAAAPEEAGLECAICFEPLAAGPPPAALPCRHRFHGPCIQKWRAFSPGNGCPECRRPFDGPPAAGPPQPLPR